MAMAASSLPADPAKSASAVPYRRAWRVLHACERVRSVLPVVEGQLAAGMRPAVVTLFGYGPGALAHEVPERNSPSLLDAWTDVRSWRKSLLDSGAENQFEIVHAHGFAPGMAAVRTCPAVVYDLHGFVEEVAIAGGQCEERSWLARSFRVAEQFVISRAGAVVAHTARDRDGALARGAAAECIFTIPEPVDLDARVAPDREWTRRHGLCETVVVFAPATALSSLRVLLDAAAAARKQAPLKLVLPTGSAALAEALRSNGNRADVVVIGDDEHQLALAAADIIVAGEGSGALDGMTNAKAVLAADLPGNRDVSPGGRGCIWYRDGDVRDLAMRLAALAANPEFRAAVAEAGRHLIEETRAPAVVGEAYAQVYRFAHARRRSTPASPLMGALQPLNACL